jgi:GAF domain-containing protein
MVEELYIPEHLDKTEKYALLIEQIKALVEGEKDPIANMANTVAALKFGMNFFWTGIYRVEMYEDSGHLVLGPFQGPVACTRIAFGKGVCGTAWKEKRTLIVDDVNKFPGHIACSTLSRSEIVVPVLRNNEVIAVLDVDSTEISDFDETDRKYLEQTARILERVI